MTKEQMEIINKVVWFIPFRKKRDAIRNLLILLIDRFDNIDNRLNNIDFFKFTLLLDRIKNLKTKKILLLTHDFTLTGAPMAVFNTAKYLKLRGYYVSVIGFKGGALLNDYLENNIDAYIIKDFQYPNSLMIDMISNFDFIFCNTVLSCNLVEKIYDKKPFLWRIAEGKNIYTIFSKMFPNIFDVFKKVPKIYAVSKYVQDIIINYNKNTEVLLYGVEDVSEKYNNLIPNKNDGRVRFCTILGHYEERKGVDIILEAIKLLPTNVKKNTEFYFIGDNYPNKFESYDNAYILGVKRDAEKYEILAKSDVLLHPALDDPNPQVVMEGMMMKKPCIITNKVGQKDFIENGSSGFIVEAGNYRDLASIIIKIVNNPSILNEMSLKSYEIYKKYFDIEIYINNVIKIIEEATNK